MNLKKIIQRSLLAGAIGLAGVGKADVITDADPSVNYEVSVVADNGTTIEYSIANNSTGGPAYNIGQVTIKTNGFNAGLVVTIGGWDLVYEPTGYDVNDDGIEDTVLRGASQVPFANVTAGNSFTVRYDTSFKGRTTGHAKIYSQGTGDFHGPVTLGLPVPLTIGMSTTPVSGLEGTTINLEVVLNTYPALPITFDVAVVGGTANAADYNLPQTTFTIPIGTQNIQVPLQLYDEGVYEGDETITLQMQNANTTLVNPIKTVTIHEASPEPVAMSSMSVPRFVEGSPSTQAHKKDVPYHPAVPFGFALGCGAIGLYGLTRLGK